MYKTRDLGDNHIRVEKDGEHVQTLRSLKGDLNSDSFECEFSKEYSAGYSSRKVISAENGVVTHREYVQYDGEEEHINFEKSFDKNLTPDGNVFDSPANDQLKTRTFYRRNGSIDSHTSIDKECNTVTVFQHDNKNLKTIHITSEDKKTFSEEHFQEDGTTTISKEVTTPDEKSTHSYYPNGKPKEIKISKRNTDMSDPTQPEFLDVSTETYHPNGKLAHKYEATVDGGFSESYDDEGKITRMWTLQDGVSIDEHYHPDGSLKCKEVEKDGSRVKRQYDEKGVLTEKHSYDSKTNIALTDRYENGKLDMMNKVISQPSISPNDTQYYVSFDQEGNMQDNSSISMGNDSVDLETTPLKMKMFQAELQNILGDKSPRMVAPVHKAGFGTL